MKYKDEMEFLAHAKAAKLTTQEHDDMRLYLEDAMQLRASAQKVELSHDEKELGKGELFAAIRARPLRSGWNTISLSDVLWSVFSLRTGAMAMIIVLLVSIGGTATYAAEDAMPGDFLYPLKVDFSEPLRERLHWSRKGRAQFTARRMERRMREMEHLLRSSTPDTSVYQKLADRMERHSSRLEEHLLRLESADAEEELREHVEEKLERHEEMIERFRDGKPNQEDIDRFLNHIKKRKRHMGSMRRPKRHMLHPGREHDSSENSKPQWRGELIQKRRAKDPDNTTMERQKRNRPHRQQPVQQNQ